MNVSSPFCSRSAAMKKSASEGPHASVFPSLSAWTTLVQSFPATTERDRHEKSVHNHHHRAYIPHPSTTRPPPSSVSSLPINSFLPPLITADGSMDVTDPSRLFESLDPLRKPAAKSIVSYRTYVPAAGSSAYFSGPRRYGPVFCQSAYIYLFIYRGEDSHCDADV
jgi:hypothetical protein